MEHLTNCRVCCKPAVVHVTEAANGGVIERHLCAECARKVEKIHVRDSAHEAQMVELLTHAKARTHPSWRGLAGGDLQTMLNSRHECVKRLASSFAQLRNAAWQMLLKRWETDADIVPQSIDAICHDPDPEVRVRATYYLAALYRNSADLRISWLFAEVALGSDTPPRIREAAYFGLLRVQGLTIPRELLLNIKQPTLLAFPIDWPLVSRFNSAQ